MVIPYAKSAIIRILHLIFWGRLFSRYYSVDLLHGLALSIFNHPYDCCYSVPRHTVSYPARRRVCHPGQQKGEQPISNTISSTVTYLSGCSCRRECRPCRRASEPPASSLSPSSSWFPLWIYWQLTIGSFQFPNLLEREVYAPYPFSRD